MATTQADVDRLIAARNAGVLSVRDPSGRTLTYPSISELNAAIQAAQGELAAASSSGLRRKILFTDAPRQKGWA